MGLLSRSLFTSLIPYGNALGERELYGSSIALVVYSLDGRDLEIAPTNRIT